jgi:ferredoxin--NADP+ reductase
MRLNDYDTTHRFRASVVSSERITPPDANDEVRELVLDLEGPSSIEAGQSIGVIAPGDEAFGKREHLRLYSVADIPERIDGGFRVKIAVKRVSYIDDYSGERYQGVASNYLCDLAPGESIQVAGPFGSPFPHPAENDANLILIVMGTGIAPFRAFLKKLYADRPNFSGNIRLFYGAKSGLDFIYMNDERDDLTQYYDRETFEAFKALSPRPHWDDPIDWEDAIKKRSQEIWNMLLDHKTYVYIAGLEAMREPLEKVLCEVAESPEQWERRKAELVAGKRWLELLY